MTNTPDDVKGFWYYTGLILGVCFGAVAFLAAMALAGVLARVIAVVFLYGWRAF